MNHRHNQNLLETNQTYSLLCYIPLDLKFTSFQTICKILNIFYCTLFLIRSTFSQSDNNLSNSDIYSVLHDRNQTSTDLHDLLHTSFYLLSLGTLSYLETSLFLSYITYHNNLALSNTKIKCLILLFFD